MKGCIGIILRSCPMALDVVRNDSRVCSVVVDQEF